MMRIILSMQVILAAFFLMTCERTDMYRLAHYGEPPRYGLYIFAIGSQMGMLGGRDGADQLCRDQGRLVYHSLNATNVKAFLSVSELDEIRFLVGHDWWYYPVYGIHPVNGPVMISDSWAGLWDGSIDNNLQTALGTVTSWWSGSNADGTVNIGAQCSGWEVADSTLAVVGSSTGMDPTWINSTLSTCNAPNLVLCLAY